MDRIDRIEALIHEDVGRRVGPIFDAARGGLRRAAEAFAARPRLRVGILTGFFVPQGLPPAAETDGPAGAALFAAALVRIGVPCRVATDAPCRAACAAALAAAGLTDVPLDVVAPDQPVMPLIAAWRAAGIDLVLAIERCGRGADGRPRNMRGEDIGAHTAPLDDLVAAGPWVSVGIGDGGNEIGMGSLSPKAVGAHLPHGGTIACVTPVDHLIVAGVSHWGVYGLIGALALSRGDWRRSLLGALDPWLDRTIVERLVIDGPAVDGVSLMQAATIDDIPMDVHVAKLRAIRAVVAAAA